MKHEYQTFVNEVLKHGDKARAYGKAYPTSKASTHRSAAARLMHNSEIDEAINGTLRQIRAELEAEIRAEMKAELAKEMEYKIFLSQIIRREVKLERQVKGNNNQTLTLLSDPGFAQIIKAGLVLGVMEGWNMGGVGKGADGRGSKQEAAPEAPKPEPTQEERDERRRKGMFINWPYWRIEEFYAENGQFYTSADQLRDKEFFLQRAFEQYGTKERPLEVEGWGGRPQQYGAAGSSSSWQQKIKASESEQTQFVNTFEKTSNCEQTQFVNSFEKTLESKQNETKSPTTLSQTNSYDNSKNINKLPKIAPPQRYNGRDQLRAAGYINLKEMLKKYEWEAKNNRAIRAKVDGLPIGDDERIYIKYEILSHALTQSPELCQKVFESMGYELYAYDNNWFRRKSGNG